MTKATTAPKPTTPKTGNSHGNSKRGVWLPDAIYARVHAYVAQHRNAPENLSINEFIRQAISAKLEVVEGKRGTRARA